MRPTVIIVGREGIQRTLLVRAFEERGYLTWAFPDPAMVSDFLESTHPKLVVVDLDGLNANMDETVHRWKCTCPDMRIAIESSAEGTRVIGEADAQLRKPASLWPLLDLLEAA